MKKVFAPLLILLFVCASHALELGDSIGTVVKTGKYGADISVRLKPGVTVFVGEQYVAEADGEQYYWEVKKVGSDWAILMSLGRAVSPARETPVHKVAGTAPDRLSVERRREHARLSGLLEQAYARDREEQRRLYDRVQDWAQVHRELPHKKHLDIRKKILANNPYSGDDALYIARDLSEKGMHRDALAAVEGLDPLNITMEFGLAELRIIKARSLYYLGDKAAAGKEMLKDDAYAIPRAGELGWTREQMSWVSEAVNAASGVFKLD